MEVMFHVDKVLKLCSSNFVIKSNVTMIKIVEYCSIEY